MLRNVDLHLTPLEDEPWQSMTIANARRRLGVVKEELCAHFRKAELFVLGTQATRRLDTSAQRPDGALRQKKV